MSGVGVDVAGLSLRWTSETISAAVDEVVSRVGLSTQNWEDMAHVVLADAFMSEDAALAFKGLGRAARLEFLRSIPERSSLAPRRWPVDVGLGEVTSRRLDEVATRRWLVDVLVWLEERRYFARDLGISCVDELDDGARSLHEVLVDRLGLPPAGGLEELIEAVDLSGLSDVVAVARDYVAAPPGRYFHPWNGCGWHLLPGSWSVELGRRVFDDLLAAVAANSDLGGVLLASGQMGTAVVAAPPVDALRRVGPAPYAPAEAFLPHGSVLTVGRLITRLAASRQLEALDALMRSHRVHVESAGPTASPEFALVVEMFTEDQARLQRHEAVIVQTLADLAGGGTWTVGYVRPPVLRRGGEVMSLGAAVIADQLEQGGYPFDAAAAGQLSFRFRPLPGAEEGTQLVSVVDDLDGSDGRVLERSLRQSLPGLDTALVAGGLESRLVEALTPPGLRSVGLPRPRVGVITSRGHVGADIAPKLDGDVLDVDYRSFTANAADASVQLAEIVRVFAVERSLSAVLIARGGGDRSDLSRLITPEVQTAISSVRQSGKRVFLAIGHGTFAAGLEVDFEALTPADAAHAIRAVLVDLPGQRRAAISAVQERLAAAPPSDEWLSLVEREQEALRIELDAIGRKFEAALARMRQR